MMDDATLLHRYAETRDEAAFAELVRRHLDGVYSIARRRVGGDAQLAEDVAQQVFVGLAREAKRLALHPVLAGWLYTTTRNASANVVRTERRRKTHEQEAHVMHDALSQGPAEADWNQLAPVIEEAVDRLGESDRVAVLLRFVERRTFGEIGSALRVTEDGARKRVDRALEKLRGILGRSGVNSSAAALAGALTAHAVSAAPAGLAASVTTAALTSATVLATTTAAKFGIITFMTTTKSISWLAGAVAIFALGYSGYQHREATIRGEATARLTQERNRLAEELRQSEQRSAQSDQRAEQADRRVAELQQKLNELIAAKSVPLTKSAPASANDTRTPDELKMARLKPLLEAGMPIKGAVVVLLDGKPVQRQVEFVIGKETRIDAADGGIYFVMPTLEHGAVLYRIKAPKKTAEGEPEQFEDVANVVQLPWKGFTLMGHSGPMAWDPDKIEP